jgi:prolyl-tRNA synthetase
MGSYGIGVSRAVAAIAEQTHDDMGLNWPAEIAPAKVHIVATGKDENPFNVAQELASQIEKLGLRVMLDDRRDASPGVKFKDAELIGVPIIVIVGKALAEGNVEVRVRRTGERSEVRLADAASEVARLLS